MDMNSDLLRSYLYALIDKKEVDKRMGESGVGVVVLGTNKDSTEFPPVSATVTVICMACHGECWVSEETKKVIDALNDRVVIICNKCLSEAMHPRH
jgi:hypothetical protein